MGLAARLRLEAPALSVAASLLACVGDSGAARALSVLVGESGAVLAFSERAASFGVRGGCVFGFLGVVGGAVVGEVGEVGEAGLSLGLFTGS